MAPTYDAFKAVPSKTVAMSKEQVLLGKAAASEIKNGLKATVRGATVVLS